MGSRISVNGTSFNIHDTLPHWFWSDVQNGRWEPETFRLFDRLLTPHSRFVDIGAWIGPTSLYAAQKCGSVDAYECDPVALGALRLNIAANPDLLHRYRLHEHAVGDEDAFIKIHSAEFGNSMTSIYHRQQRGTAVLQHPQSIQVGMRDARALFREKGYAADARTLIKMDVEGAEFRILPRISDVIANSRCIWFISFHEWNLNPENLPVEPFRAAQMINVLSVFASLNWYTPDLVKLDPQDVFDRVMKRTWRVQMSLVFSASALEP
jgi:FkbM family methyltransferase